MNIKPILNLIALLITLVINWLANSLPINDQTTGQVSAKIPVLFTPSGYAFSIWGVIYLLLIAFVVYQLLPAQRNAPFLKRINYWFVISCVCNCLWLFLWHYEQFVLTMLVMCGLLASLIIIYQRLGIGRHRGIRQEQLLVNLPFSVYLGWISVATIANCAIVLYTLNIDSLGLNPVVFTLVLLIIATTSGIAVILTRSDIAYPLVIVWALIAIAVRHWQTLLVIAIPAVLFACVIVVTLIIVRLKRKEEPLNRITTS
jgi:benzodiazapine receptor